MDTFKLIDAWGIFNANKTQLTWRRSNAIEKSRIDLWLFDSNYLNVIYSSDITPAQISSTDHLAISLQIQQIEALVLGKSATLYCKTKTTQTLSKT